MSRKPVLLLLIVAALLLALAGCGAPVAARPTVPARPTMALSPGERGDLTDEQVITLNSLVKVDDYPLYVMHHYGPYAEHAAAVAPPDAVPAVEALLPACSLFAALGDPESLLYGRGFDWHYSPALLLFTYPPDGYASVSMVELNHWFGADQLRALDERARDERWLLERRALLSTPLYPYDGMNEHGLAVGMAAVPATEMPHSPLKRNIDSLGVIREMLDHARTVDQAVDILSRYNVRWGGGPPLHYLIADAAGRAVLVEFDRGRMIQIPNAQPWHLATNHLRTLVSAAHPAGCWRYEAIEERLEQAAGRLSAQEAMDLLAAVSVPDTQWSVVYGIHDRRVHVVMGRQYDRVHTWDLGVQE
jgi:hypothetical protein